MREEFRVYTLLCAAVIAALALLPGCGSTSPAADAQSPAGFDIPWPADDAPGRVVSDDTVDLLGNEYVLIGGGATEVGTTVEMDGSGELPFAIYTLGGFSANIEFTQLTLTATATPGSPGDGTQLYVGLANYDLNAWEWFAADSGTWTSDPIVGANYRSPLGNVSVAVVLSGPGDGVVSQLTFERTGDTTLGPPNPISGDPTIGRIIVSWNKVPIAEGYNIYRDVEPAMPAPVKLNAALITKDNYADTSVEDGVMYYYVVTSVAGDEESAPSMMIDIFAPEANLSAPTNPRLVSATETTATVAWDWSGSPPTLFQLYLEDHKDFNLVSPLQSPTKSGSTTQHTFNNLQSGKTYYWRVCAVFGTNRGRMTDDRATETGTNNDWTWGNIENVGSGDATVIAIKAGTDLAAAYFDGLTIKFAKRTSGAWVEQVALDDEMYEAYIDLAYGGGQYIVVGWAVNPGDAWVATGTPGNLTETRIHGDGDTSFEHLTSGCNIRCTATSSEFIVVHTDLDAGDTLIQTRPISGGTWAVTTKSTGAIIDTPYNLGSDGSNAYLLMKDIMANQLLFGNKTGGWNMGVALAAGAPAVTFNNDLVLYNAVWVSPLRDATNDRFILAKNTGMPWTTEVISSSNVGANARMDTEGTKAGIVYTASGKWWFVYNDGSGWETSEITIAGNTIVGEPDIVFLSGNPYLVFCNSGGQVKAARGTPPSP